MAARSILFRILKTDPFILALVATVALASVLPCSGEFARVMAWITDAGIALLFFLHGAKLSRQAILAGLGAWRIHLLVLAATFILFPIMGLALRAVSHSWLNPVIADGILFLCLLPSTVQSSIAFTSIAHGNVPAAVCSATVSNVAGIFITPAVSLWLAAVIFALPKVREVCGAAGLELLKSTEAMIGLTAHGGLACAAFLAPLIALEWRSSRWPRYRRAAAGVAVFLLNTAVLVGISTMIVSATVAADVLLHRGR